MAWTFQAIARGGSLGLSLLAFFISEWGVALDVEHGFRQSVVFADEIVKGDSIEIGSHLEVEIVPDFGDDLLDPCSLRVDFVRGQAGHGIDDGSDRNFGGWEMETKSPGRSAGGRDQASGAEKLENLSEEG